MSKDIQWQAVSNQIETSVKRAAKAEKSHTQAARQLNVADYELARLLDELHAVMPQIGAPSATTAVSSDPPTLKTRPQPEKRVEPDERDIAENAVQPSRRRPKTAAA